MMNLNASVASFSEEHETPFLVTDLDQISINFHRLQRALPDTIIHYAIKSNNDFSLIKHLHKLGSHFDVASWQEIEWCQQLSIPADSLIFSNPIKPVESIKKAYTYGVRNYTVDSYAEILKLERNAPGCNIILRIMVDSSGSQCPMFKKFGAYIDEAVDYLLAIKRATLNPIGLTFHVGSQCLNADNWINALIRAAKVWDEARKNNIQLSLINLGGGLPVSYNHDIEPLEYFTETIRHQLNNNFPGLTQTFIEPGRYMTDQASVMVSTVIGKAKRGQTEWIYLDVGGFNGLFEIFEDFEYDIQLPNSQGRPLITYAVAGPTCDGMDVIRKEIVMPEVHIGDVVYIMNAGAYSISKRLYNGIDWAASYTIKA